MRRLSREEGIDFILEKYGLDVIIGPADSFIFSLATCSGMSSLNIGSAWKKTDRRPGYPVAAMPLSYLDLNGRPLGMAALAGENQDELLVKVLSAWEATFPARIPPTLLQD